jgi:hypothetical protein
MKYEKGCFVGHVNGLAALMVYKESTMTCTHHIVGLFTGIEETFFFATIPQIIMFAQAHQLELMVTDVADEFLQYEVFELREMMRDPHPTGLGVYSDSSVSRGSWRPDSP